MKDLSEILLKFRLNGFACVSDIEKAFLNVGLRAPCRDVCRFFWPLNPFDLKSKILVYRFKSVLFGSTASQFLLNSTIDHHLSKYSNDVSQKIRDGIYIDNLINTFDSEESMFQFYEDCKVTMSQGGFNVREWTSNSEYFMNAIPPNDQCVKNPVKVLGVHWCRTNDKLKILAKPENYTDIQTKRSFVSIFSQRFDILEAFCPLPQTFF